MPDIKLFNGDVLEIIKQLESKSVDLIFADPPYQMGERIINIPRMVFENNLLLPGGTLIVEHGKTLNMQEYPNFKEQRIYGSVNFSFFTL